MPARTDRTTDDRLLAELLVVRKGTAWFRRHLDKLTDDELDRPSLLPGWTRRHLVAHVGYNARAVARLVTWAATGEETSMYASPDARAEEIELGATLSPVALRNLVEHAAIDLDVRWRDLEPARWATEVRTAQGRTVPASETVWMRTREVWLHTVDLASGATLDQVPAAVLRRLLGDVHGAWVTRPEVAAPHVEVLGDETTTLPGDPGAIAVSGGLADVVGWATGRTGPDQWTSLSWTRGELQPAPRWI